jgi:hypothetical protein
MPRVCGKPFCGRAGRSSSSRTSASATIESTSAARHRHGDRLRGAQSHPAIVWRCNWKTNATVFCSNSRTKRRGKQFVYRFDGQCVTHVVTPVSLDGSFGRVYRVALPSRHWRSPDFGSHYLSCPAAMIRAGPWPISSSFIAGCFSKSLRRLVPRRPIQGQAVP